MFKIIVFVQERGFKKKKKSLYFLLQVIKKTVTHNYIQECAVN